MRTQRRVDAYCDSASKASINAELHGMRTAQKASTALGHQAADIIHDKIAQVQSDAKRRSDMECAALRASLEAVDHSVKTCRKDPASWHLDAGYSSEEALLIGATNNYGTKKAVAFLC